MARGKKFQLTIDGGSISRADLNLIAGAAAEAEDNAVSALVHTPPFPGGSRQRWVIGSDPGALVVSTVIGTVSIRPHTAMIGPASTAANVGVTAAGPAGSIAIPSGSGGGNKRYDLIYETVSIDNSDPAVYRKAKNSTSRVISTALFSNTTSNLVEYHRIAGTETTGTPVPPALPADPAGGYNIALAHVFVSSSYNAATDTTVANAISEITPIIDLPGAARPMTAVGVLGGIISTDFAAASRAYFLPQLMSGSYPRFVAIDNSSAGPATGTVLDDSMDWRKRLFTGFGQLGALPAAGGGSYPAASSPTFVTSGNSFHNDPTLGSPARMIAFRGDSTRDAAYGANWVEINIDATTGALTYRKSGNFSGTTFFWITASAQFTNTI
jgi:hypothetical protein